MEEKHSIAEAIILDQSSTQTYKLKKKKNRRNMSILKQ